VSGRPSRVRQREITQIVRGAMRAGASGVTVNVGGASVVIAFPDNLDSRIRPSTTDEWANWTPDTKQD
jgi:hypothetical protein